MHWFPGMRMSKVLPLSIGIWNWIRALSVVLPIFEYVETGVSMYWNGNLIGSYPMCHISFLDIDIDRSEGTE